MIQTIELFPGVTLRCCRDERFKQGVLSLQLLRPMCREEAALNALLPAVLLRGTKAYPDMRAITLHLDDLYGASVGTLVRRIGDIQCTGLSCGFIDDRYALHGDAIAAPMFDFLRQLLLEPVLEDSVFRADYVESEKKNLISTIESQKNDKRTYAASQMIKKMCAGDSFGIPRLGEKEQVAAITPASLYEHYRRVLRESPVHLFYVGSSDPAVIARGLTALFSGLDRAPVALPPQTPYRSSEPGDYTEQLDVMQGKLCMGFVTPVTLRDADFAAMQVMNVIFGAGMTSKLFIQIREKLSLCYDISSAGIDFHQEPVVRQQVLQQLDACRNGDISEAELTAAKQALLAQLQSTHDSPGAIEGYYATAALSGLSWDTAVYMEKVAAVTPEDVSRAARQLELHTVYFLKGVQ